VTRSVIFRPLAEAEYDGAAAWYEAQQPGRGAAFASAVRDVLDTIAVKPDRYPIAVRDTREAAVVGFPYNVYYRERNGRIIVLAVYHQSRDPAGWRNRP
jgi:plasmid stabilization system protein ParE